MISNAAKRNSKKRRQQSTTERKNNFGRKRSGHLIEKFTERTDLGYENALKYELNSIEAEDSQWSHPIGFSMLSGLRLLNLPFDPILNNTGHWIQPEDVDDIPSMFDSYLNVNCLFYSLIGVLAIETSLSLEVPPADASATTQWFLAISRFCWCANGIWCIAGVVCAFHILWAVYATPNWAKRKFLLHNSKTLSFVYAMGAPNFFFLILGIVTGVLGNILLHENYRMSLISALAGLTISVAVGLSFVMCAGSTLSKAIRPWKVAHDNITSRKEQWTRGDDEFYDNYGDKEDDYDDENFDAINTAKMDAGWTGLGVPFLEDKLYSAGLRLDMMKELDNLVMADRLIESAGIDKAGDRLRVLLYVKNTRSIVDMTQGQFASAKSIGSGQFD